jgi:hypothetical protein
MVFHQLLVVSHGGLLVPVTERHNHNSWRGRAITRANCYHNEGHGAPCDAHDEHLYMLLFGAAQLVLSFIPNFHSMAWLSVAAAVMSFTYATIGLGLGLAKTIENGTIKGSIAGVPMSTPAQKVWRVAQAIGDIAFAYPYTIVLLEIQVGAINPELYQQC